MQLRWPWVSRSTLDAVRRLAAQRLDEIEHVDAKCRRLRRHVDGLMESREAIADMMRDAQAEVKRLTDVIVEMKRDGFHPAPPPDAMPSPEPDLPSQITEAIMARSTRKSDLERELYRYAIRTYTGQNAEEIAGTIWHGGDPQEDE